MTHVRVNGHLIRCTLARTPSELALGLQRHASLAADEGMLFLFPSARTATFHMGEVVFPIDIVGIDDDSRITRIVEGARPGSLERWYFSRVAAVLELAGGTCRRLALKTGHVCELGPQDRTAQYDSVVYHGSSQPGLDHIAWNAPNYEGGIGNGVYVAFDSEVAAFYGKHVYKLRLLLTENDILWLTLDTIDTSISAHFRNSILVGEAVEPFSFDLKNQRYSVVSGHGGVYDDQNYIDQLARSYLLESLARDTSPQAIWLRQYAQTHSLDLDDATKAFLSDLLEASPNLGDAALQVEEAAFRSWAKGVVAQVEEAASKDLGLCISLDEIGGEAQSVGYKGVYLAGVRGGHGPNEELLVFDPDDLEMLGEVTSFDDEARREATLLELDDLNEPIEDHEPHKNTEPGGKVYDEPKEQYFRDLWGDTLAEEALDVRPELQTRVSTSLQRKAQIVDEAKFVEKAATILFAHADKIPWQKDALNGGATERAVVTRAELAQWLSSSPTSTLGETGANEQSTKYLLSATGDERGLKLLGSAFILAEIADFTRLGFAQKHPVLVLYREAAQVG